MADSLVSYCETQMDTPKLIRTDERGLPTYEPHIEKQITNIFFDGMEP